jgi:NADP-dependent alcohol dehydrogenase
MGVLASHRYPTEVRVGPGSLDAYLAGATREPCAILYDPAIASPALNALVEDGVVPMRAAPPQCDLNSVEDVARWVGAINPACLVAVGGGTTMDVAKAAHVLAADPPLARRIARTAPRAGALPLRSEARGGWSLIAAPTTFGTGSEVSPVVSVGVATPGGPRRVLVSGLALAPDIAILDPDLTASLPPNIGRYGIFEILARVVGADVGSVSSLPTATAEAHSIAAQAAELLDRAAGGTALDPTSRLAASLLSAQSHLGWALQGRPPAPSPLWVICDEVACAIGRTKLETTAWLWPHWIQAVMTQGMPWGEPRRLEPYGTQVLRGLGGAAARAQLDRWDIPGGPIDGHALAPESLAARIIARWGSPLPLLRGFTGESIASFLADARQ